MIERTLARPISSVSSLGEGTDHAAYEVDGRLVARVQRSPDADGAAEIERERRVLEVVGAISPVPVPEVVAVDEAAGVMVVRKLPGSSLLDRPARDPERLIEPLVELLTALQVMDLKPLGAALVTDDVPLSAYLDEATELFRSAVAAVTADQRRLIEEFLAIPPPPGTNDLAFSHNDLGAEHVFVAADGSTITGVIDWSDAALSDPARDVGRLYRDLGPDVARQIASRLRHDPEATMRRAQFYARCAVLEDIVYGLETNSHNYLEASLLHLRRTFAPHHE